MAEIKPIVFTNLLMMMVMTTIMMAGYDNYIWAFILLKPKATLEAKNEQHKDDDAFTGKRHFDFENLTVD